MEDYKPQNNPFSFNGRAGEFFGIWIVNVLLTILTLGIYSAWAKVRNKQYFYGNTELAGENFEYLAKPLQILIGRVIALVCVIAWVALPAVSEAASAILGLAFVALMPVLMVKNLRFDSRVTRYRNVRFDFAGSYGEAYKTFLVLPFVYMLSFILILVVVSYVFTLISSVLGGIISVVLFGLGITYVNAMIATQMSTYILNNYRWGKLQFSADIDSRAVFKIFLKVAAMGLGGFIGLMLILAVIAFVAFSTDLGQIAMMFANIGEGGLQDFAAKGLIFGVIGVIYLSFFLLGWFVTAYLQACIRNYQFGQTDLESKLYMDSNVKPMAFLGVMLSNMLLTVFSLGLAIPLAKVRMANFMADATAVMGEIDTVANQNQVSDSTTAISDEVADAFSIEVGVI
ncbi:membrane protein [Agarivorans sp. Toyoura001]|uniref:YjgN family protein n=1 Tax=Agarivorans sp. Toyoura001 TaxID=2283141 RepID=UPI0010E776CA|nr:YjgN family protein [Agarivorans sp. Toyoura001]GDY24783.1 membrane protein [Agarivorans sp. Toyoura001]